MLHSPEDTLNAYREVWGYAVDAIEDAKEDLKLDISKTEDLALRDMLVERLEIVEESLYIIYNDD